MADVRSKTAQVALTVSIDGAWSTDDFAATWSFISDLYQISSTFGWRSGEVSFRPRFGLRVESIKYGSPGHFSLLGFGDAMKQVKEILMYLLDRDLIRQRMEIENRVLLANAKRQELEAARAELLLNWARQITNVQLQNPKVVEFVTVEETKSFLERHVSEIMHLQRLKHLGMIKDIRLNDSEKGSELEPA
jgi:hypothetical protein